MTPRLLGRRRYLTTGEAARMLGVSRRTVTEWCESGRLRTRERASERERYQIVRSDVERLKRERG
jgi:excisionase family DNA binding protein